MLLLKLTNIVARVARPLREARTAAGVVVVRVVGPLSFIGAGTSNG